MAKVSGRKVWGKPRLVWTDGMKLKVTDRKKWRALVHIIIIIIIIIIKKGRQCKAERE